MSNYRALFLSLLIGSITFPLMASDKIIKVTGECKRKVFPDEEIYQLSFIKSGKDNRALQEDVSKRATNLIETLKKALAQKITLHTNGFQSYPQYQWVKGQNVFQGYQARYSLEIKLSDFNSRDQLQILVRSSGAEEWSGPTQILSESTKLKERDLCLRDALEDAVKKASIIAKSADVSLAGLHSASELQNTYSGPVMMKGAMSMMERSGMDQMTAPPIESREIEYLMTLEVAFNFK